MSSDLKLLVIPTLHVQGFELSNNLSKEQIDSLVKWSNAIDDRIVQFFDGNRIVSKRQLEIGVARALRSIKQDKMIAKNVEVELALWVAGTRLIKTAFERVGISSKTKHLLVVGVSKDGSNDAKIQDSFFNELQKILPDNQVWKFKEPINVDFIAEIYEIDLKPLDDNLSMADLENFVLQKISLLTVLM